MVLERGRYQDATQVKGLSPEITQHLGSQSRSFWYRQYSDNRKRQGCQNPAGSKTVSRYQRTNMNSGEPMYFLRECSVKPINGKIPQDIIHWQSDYCIVSMKSCNGDGEKAVAVAQGIQGRHLPNSELENR